VTVEDASARRNERHRKCDSVHCLLHGIERRVQPRHLGLCEQHVSAVPASHIRQLAKFSGAGARYLHLERDSSGLSTGTSTSLTINAGSPPSCNMLRSPAVAPTAQSLRPNLLWRSRSNGNVVTPQPLQSPLASLPSPEAVHLDLFWQPSAGYERPGECFAGCQIAATIGTTR